MIALVCTAHPVSGQVRREAETGSHVERPRPARIPEAKNLSDADRGRIAAAEFADCMTARRKSSAVAYLAMPYGSRESVRALARMADNVCLSSGQLKMPPALVRGAVFRSMYKWTFGDKAPALGQTPPDYASYIADSMDAGGALQLLMLEFASCVIRANPASAREMLLAQAGSAKESQAFKALVPLMSSCFPKGKTAELSKATVTGIMAEAMYREAEAGSAGSPASPGKI
ncbi:hypothetical protein [Sphingobium ummariense]